MHYMIIERFRGAEAVAAVYERFAERGRGMPEGLKYVSSWIEPNFDRCFLVAECDDPRMIQRWVLQWNDLIEFEIIPVVPSKETAEVVMSSLNSTAAKRHKPQSRTSRSKSTRPKGRAL
jgi:uncharacterized protein DUF3303